MESGLDYHEETWSYAVTYQGLDMRLTIHHDLEEDDAPYDWGVSEYLRGMETPIWWTESAFSTHDEALTNAHKWVQEHVNEGALPSGAQVAGDMSTDSAESC